MSLREGESIVSQFAERIGRTAELARHELGGRDPTSHSDIVEDPKQYTTHPSVDVSTAPQPPLKRALLTPQVSSAVDDVLPGRLSIAHGWMWIELELEFMRKNLAILPPKLTRQFTVTNDSANANVRRVESKSTKGDRRRLLHLDAQLWTAETKQRYAEVLLLADEHAKEMEKRRKLKTMAQSADVDDDTAEDGDNQRTRSGATPPNSNADPCSVPISSATPWSPANLFDLANNFFSDKTREATVEERGRRGSVSSSATPIPDTDENDDSEAKEKKTDFETDNNIAYTIEEQFIDLTGHEPHIGLPSILTYVEGTTDKVHCSELLDVLLRLLLTHHVLSLEHVKLISAYATYEYPKDLRFPKIFMRYFLSQWEAADLGRGAADVLSLMLPIVHKDAQIELFIAMAYESRWKSILDDRGSTVIAERALAYYERAHDHSSSQPISLAYPKLRQILFELELYNRIYRRTKFITPKMKLARESIILQLEQLSKRMNLLANNTGINIYNVRFYWTHRITLHFGRGEWLAGHHAVLRLISLCQHEHICRKSIVNGTVTDCIQPDAAHKNFLENALPMFLKRIILLVIFTGVHAPPNHEPRGVAANDLQQEQMYRKEYDEHIQQQRRQGHQHHTQRAQSANASVTTPVVDKKDSQHESLSPLALKVDESPSPVSPLLSPVPSVTSAEQQPSAHRIPSYLITRRPSLVDENVDIPTSIVPPPHPVYSEGPPKYWHAAWQSLYYMADHFGIKLTSRIISCFHRGKVGLSLSGGGIRAAFAHLGLLARLAECDLLHSVEVIASVSGGSIVAAQYYLLLKELLETKNDEEINKYDYIRIVKRCINAFSGVSNDDPYNAILGNPWHNIQCRIFHSLTRTKQMSYRWRDMFRGKFSPRQAEATGTATPEKVWADHTQQVEWLKKLEEREAERQRRYANDDEHHRVRVQRLTALRKRVQPLRSPASQQHNDDNNDSTLDHSYNSRIPLTPISKSPLSSPSSSSSTTSAIPSLLSDSELEELTLLEDEEASYQQRLRIRHDRQVREARYEKYYLRDLKIYPYGIESNYYNNHFNKNNNNNNKNQNDLVNLPFTQFIPTKHNWLRTNKIPALYIHTTCVNTGHLFRFSPYRFGENMNMIDNLFDHKIILDEIRYEDCSLDIHKNITLHEAVAASSCVPGFFNPLRLENLYPGMTVELVDGGVYDNNGTHSLFYDGCECVIVSDAAIQMKDEAHPSISPLRILQKTLDICMDQIYIRGFYEIKRKCLNMELQSFLSINLKQYMNEPIIMQAYKQASIQKVSTSQLMAEHISLMRTSLDAWTEVERSTMMFTGYYLAAESLKNKAIQDPHEEPLEDEEQPDDHQHHHPSSSLSTSSSSSSLISQTHRQQVEQQNRLWEGFNAHVAFNQGKWSFYSLGPFIFSNDIYNPAVLSLHHQLHRASIQFAFDRYLDFIPATLRLFLGLLICFIILILMLYDIIINANIQYCTFAALISPSFYIFIAIAIIVLLIYPGWLSDIFICVIILPLISHIHVYICNPYLFTHGKLDRLLDKYKTYLQRHDHVRNSNAGSGNGSNSNISSTSTSSNADGATGNNPVNDEKFIKIYKKLQHQSRRTLDTDDPSQFRRRLNISKVNYK